MCGFLFCVHKKSINFNLEEFKSVNNLISYRGPDYGQASEIVNRNNVLKIGHRRLSIRDLSDKANQPMTCSDDRFIIAYNGEIYNYNYLKSIVKENKSNLILNSTSDTEIILELFSILNTENLFSSLEGMFAFTVYDKKLNHLIIGRDKAGEKPLYIFLGNEVLGASSELKTLMNLPKFEKKIRIKSLQNYLQYSYVSNPNSIYESCFKVPPGSYLVINLNNFTLNRKTSFSDFINSNGIEYKKWWSLSRIIKDKSNNFQKNITQEAEKLIINSTINQTVSDVPIGTFLSGGVDSSLITSILSKNINKLKTFTIGFENKQFDESEDAELIAKYLKTDHTSLVLNKNDILDSIPTIPNVYSEPFADSSQIATMLVSKIASKEIKVALTGDGGDEVFGGYNRYIIANKYWKKFNYVPLILRNKIINLANKLPKKILQKIINFTLSNNINDELNYNKIFNLLNKLSNIQDKNSFYYQITSEWNDEKEILDGFLDVTAEKKFYFQNNNSSFEEQMMLADFENYMTDDIFCKVDRASMFYSLETRAPYLNTDLIEFMYKLPLSFKINNGNSKVILKKILEKYLPHKYIYKNKKGFGVPLFHWFRCDLKDWVNEILSKKNCEIHNFFNYKIVEKIKNEHFNNTMNHEKKLWTLIQFNSWYNNYN